MSLEDIAVKLRDKADANLIGCSKPHVILNLDYGTSWARVYSDGYCIQGGIFGQVIASYAGIKFNFLIPFKDVKYFADVHSSHTGDLRYPSIVTKDKTYIEIYSLYNNFGAADWIARGYISEDYLS